MKINDRINKWDRKYGKYAIKNLTLYIIIGYVAGYILERTMPQIYSYLLLDPHLILRGQIWRLLTWIIAPPFQFSILVIITLFFYFSVGTQLERQWGAFRYNLYIFSGIIFNILGAFIMYFFYVIGNNALDIPSFRLIIGTGIAESVTTYYVTTSIFFAYALMNPDEYVLLYGIIPLKIKWFGFLYAFFILYDFVVVGTFVSRVVIILSLLNFIIYFMATRNYYRMSPKRVKRKVSYRHEVKTARPEGEPLHKCAVCGRTEKDGYDLTFRYCSKCKGNYEYCQDHLFTHEHKR